MTQPNIIVSDEQVIISVDGISPLPVSPAGTYSFATITVNEFGQVTSASNGSAATESTLQQVLADLDYLQSVLDGTGVDGGYWIYQL